MSEGEWTAKVLIKDLKKGNSHIVNIDISAIQMQALRMNVTTPAGLHVASLAMNNNDLEYIMVADKKYIHGKAKPKALKPLIEVPMDPEILHNIVFDVPIKHPDWNCSVDDLGFLESCKNLKSNLEIEWSDRAKSTKLVKVTHPSAELQMKFLTFNSPVSNADKVFKLKVPKGFSTYKIK